jgi:hypothetical protein
MPLSRMDDLKNLVEPDSELTEWRLRSRLCAVADMIGVAAGISLYAVAGIDDVVSWPSNQVSTIGNSQTAWTTVPLSQFRLWQASFVREDGFFMFFGLAAATVFIALLHLHREATRAHPA